jgi:HEAT repeat protein
MALSVAEVRAALAEGDEGIRQAAVARLDPGATGAVGILLLAMADTSWRVRREAVERAIGSGIDRGVLIAALVPVLGEPDDVGLRNSAVEAVVALGAAAVPALHAALAPRPEHRKVLCDVLGRIGAAESAGALAELLSDEDWNVRIAAAEALGRLAAGPAGPDTPVFTRVLLDALLPLAGAAAGGAAAFLGTALLDAVARRRIELPGGHLAALLPDPVLGTGALRALAAGAAPRAPDARATARMAAVARLADPVRGRREAALLAVASLVDNVRITLDDAAHAAATEALLEATVEVQRAAARVLGAGGDARAARALLVAIGDPALEEAATDALGLLARRDLPALAVVVDGLPAPGRAAIYQALARSAEADGGLRGLGDTLGRDLTSEDEPLALAALAALGARGGPENAARIADALVAAEELGSDGADRAVAARQALAALAGRHGEAVAAVVRGRAGAPFIALLGELGGADDLSGLAGLLSDADVDVRRAAAGALAALASRRLDLDPATATRASEAARVALVDESPGVRAAVALALARLALRDEARGAALLASIEGLLLAARDEDVRVRGAAARAVVELARATTVAPGDAAAAIRSGLRTLADSGDALTAVPALEALLAQRDAADDVRLLDALTGADEERRKVALYALALRPQLLVRGDLLRLAERALHDARWDLRRAAIAALGAVGDIGRPALVARRSVESDPMVRADLDRALEPPGGPDA